MTELKSIKERRTLLRDLERKGEIIMVQLWELYLQKEQRELENKV